MRQRGPGGRQREAGVHQVELRLTVHEGPQPGRLRAQGAGGAARQHTRDERRLALRRFAGRGRPRRLLDDGVGVGAADAERGDPGPARGLPRRPGPAAGEQGHRAAVPVDQRRRLVHVQGRGQFLVPQREHHLDDAGEAGRGLSVADVGLQRPQPQRPVAVLAVGGEQGLRLDRVAQRGAGAVRLHGVHIGRLQPRVGERGAQHPLLGPAVGRGEAVGRAVGVHRGAAHDREHLVAVAAGVAQPLDQHHGGALRPAGAVRRGGERLAPAVGGQPVLPVELDERGGQRHHGHAGHERGRALARPQRGGGLVQRDERRRARGVDRDGRALQPEDVGDPAGQHAVGGAGDGVPGDLRRQRQAGPVAGVRRADEHAGPAAPKRVRRDPGPLQHLPARLQQDPLLRVHRERLARGDPEQAGVELGRVVDEPAHPGEVRCGHIPAAVGGEPGQPVGAGRHQLPEVLRRAHPARQPAAHADDRHRLRLPRLGVVQALPGLVELGDHALEVAAQLVLVAHGIPGIHGSLRSSATHRLPSSRARR